MAYENIQVEIAERIATVTVTRPKVMNALNDVTLRELAHAFDELKQKDDVGLLIVTGAGEKAFVAGADINELAQMKPLEAKDLAFFGQQVFARLEKLGKPSIAMVNGFALGGGCELALACTLRTAASNARFGLPETSLGIIPGYGGTQRLIAGLAGPGVAREWILTGDMFGPPRRPTASGVVNRVFAPEELEEGTRKIDRHDPLPRTGRRAFRQSKRSTAACNMPQDRKGSSWSATLFGLAASTEDMKRGHAEPSSRSARPTSRGADPSRSAPFASARGCRAHCFPNLPSGPSGPSGPTGATGATGASRSTKPTRKPPEEQP